MAEAWNNIIDTTDATGDDFYAQAEIIIVKVDVHTGGTWTLQSRSPDGVYVDLDITFTDVGEKALHAAVGGRYRLNGGSVGAKAFVARGVKA